MISSRGRKALTGVVLLGGALLAQQASASCRIQSSWFTAQDVTMDMGQIVILPSTPVGGVIKEISEPINQQNSVARCDWSGGRSTGEYVNAAQKRPVAGFSNVYETDVAGVGIRLYRDPVRSRPTIRTPSISAAAAPSRWWEARSASS